MYFTAQGSCITCLPPSVPPSVPLPLDEFISLSENSEFIVQLLPNPRDVDVCTAHTMP